jgi:hypothetical protein
MHGLTPEQVAEWAEEIRVAQEGVRSLLDKVVMKDGAGVPRGPWERWVLVNQLADLLTSLKQLQEG